MSQTLALALEATEHDDGSWSVTERTSDSEGKGETIHEAVIDYAERARESSRQKTEEAAV